MRVVRNIHSRRAPKPWKPAWKQQQHPSTALCPGRQIQKGATVPTLPRTKPRAVRTTCIISETARESKLSRGDATTTAYTPAITLREAKTPSSSAAGARLTLVQTLTPNASLGQSTTADPLGWNGPSEAEAWERHDYPCLKLGSEYADGI